MIDTEDKLFYLESHFPLVDKDALLEILVVCDGSIEITESMLSQQFERVADPITQDDIKSTKLKEEVVNRETTGLVVDQSSNIIDTDNCEIVYGDERQIKVEQSRKRKSEIDIDLVSSKKMNANHQTSLNKFTSVHQSTENNSLATKGVNLATPTLSKTITLHTKKEIEEALPTVKFIKNFLPEDLANDTLQELLNRKALFRGKEFVIAGKTKRSSHNTAIFYENNSDGVGYDGEMFGLQKEKGQDYSSNLKLCQYLLEDKVDELMKSYTKHPYESDNKWKANLCIGNLFESNKNHLDWHSDKLTFIGPLPLICSISLGATRYFRLKKLHYKEGEVNLNPIYNIPLPHNTLLLLLPGTQEEYKHCVPTLTDSLLDQHPFAKTTRINLTFRMIRHELVQNRPDCPKCKKPTPLVLRRMFRKVASRGYYFWGCPKSFPNGKSCEGFYYADFSLLNRPEANSTSDKLMYCTKDIKKASRWVAENDDEVLNLIKYSGDDICNSEIESGLKDDANNDD
ncbi:hypothetical protein CANARDRAFT_28167 [[Candida] arabinofermentans NRRL YB-2248]|uniref:Fe2OG dioxygenase domain-containing protein n=1 Tax=[Candida] arabinofermentans NRRL YB-2248 TaxID=983967 RepID=A0A1E4T0V6_9ASCO|nr:hypothetical protein CANARDRAFT_28167 [[Candida] arabinofermentans NRRL YB-2248]